ncbi:MAG: DegT/DnrJ/EryC1/StrS family aminotransferase [Candidatus Micrarchaeia archaeon]
MISISKPLISEEEQVAVRSVLSSGFLAQGPKVKEFEEAFAKYVGVKHAVATSSGTSALHLALLACGVKRDDEVITTPFSFIASSNSILYCNAKPVFVDIGDDFNIDADKIVEKISPKTKAILPVHLYGNPCNMDKLQEIAFENNVVLVEDACQAHGAEVNGKKTGSFGKAGCFSFYPSKNMTCSEGGMVTTDDEKVMLNCRALRHHGSLKPYAYDVLGFNYRMTDVSAAIGLEQLKKLDEFNSRRIENAAFYNECFKGVEGLETPGVERGKKHVFHQYTLRIAKSAAVSRDELAKHLLKRGVKSGVYYPLPIHKQPLYKDFDVSVPNAQKACKEVLSLPIHPLLSKGEREVVVDAVNEVVS